MSEANWTITYLGDGVRSLGDVGVFARHVTATVPAEVAQRLQGDSAWRVVPPGETPPAPAADAKPADAKPADAKPADAKPADAKPADAKPKAAAKKGKKK